MERDQPTSPLDLETPSNALLVSISSAPPKEAHDGLLLAPGLTCEHLVEVHVKNPACEWELPLRLWFLLVPYSQSWAIPENFKMIPSVASSHDLPCGKPVLPSQLPLERGLCSLGNWAGLPCSFSWIWEKLVHLLFLVVRAEVILCPASHTQGRSGIPSLHKGFKLSAISLPLLDTYIYVNIQPVICQMIKLTKSFCIIYVSIDWSSWTICWYTDTWISFFIISSNTFPYRQFMLGIF